jgi:glycosyltransferase involved in cell wall biosynthesis
MRILHVNERAGFYGGVERILFDMAEGLAAAGHPQALLHADPAPQPDFLKPFEASARLPEGAQSSIGRFAPDAVLIHKLEDPRTLAGLAARLPAVRMIHDHDLVCLRRHKYFPLDTRVCELPAGVACWTHLCVLQRGAPGGLLPLRLVPVGARRRAIAAHRQVRRFVVGSRWMRDELAMNGIDPARVEILPPVPRALAGTRILPPSVVPEVLFVGQVIRGKGVDLLLRALAQLGRPWHATVVGTGNHLDECRALALRLGIAQRVDFAGWIDHERLESYYARAAVAAVPSRWPEPFGMVGIEAMARGRPVVGFAVGGIPDWLEDGVNGLLAPQADVATLSAHLERLLANPSLARRLGEQAARLVQERYRPEAFLHDLLACLARTVDDPGAAQSPGGAL